MKNRLKIGFITTSLSSAGGWDSCSRGVIPAIAAANEVVVLTQTEAKNDPFDFLIHKVIPKNIRYHFRTQLAVFWATLKYLRQCDIIHVMMEPYAPGAALASRIIGAKFYITVAGTYAVPPAGMSLRALVKRQMMKFMYKNSAALASGSERTVRLVEQAVGKVRWHFIPNGVDPTLFYRLDNIPTSDHPFLLTVGEVKPRKGADITIQALAQLKDKFPDLSYKIVGHTGKSEFVAHLKDLAKKNGLESRVELLGRVSDEELRLLYNQCTAFVLAAQTRDGSFEGFPMVFYEAQGCGAPIISTYGFGSEYVVKNGYNGYLVEENSPDQLAEAIEKIVNDSDRQKELRANSLAEAKKHTWTATAEKYRQMYEATGVETPINSMWPEEKIKAYWQARALTGDNPCHYFNKWQDRYAAKMRMAALRQDDFRGARKIVDIGCGVGDYTDKISRLTEAQVIGFDFPFNIAIAQKKYGSNPRLTFRAGSIPDENIARAVKEADRVIITTVYNHLTDSARAALADYLASMKPDAKVFMLEYFPEKVPEFQRGLGYKNIETWKDASERFGRCGLRLIEIRHVNYIDSWFFHHLGGNRFSYVLTLALERLCRICAIKNSKYKLLIFSK